MKQLDSEKEHPKLLGVGLDGEQPICPFSLPTELPQYKEGFLALIEQLIRRNAPDAAPSNAQNRRLSPIPR